MSPMLTHFAQSLRWQLPAVAKRVANQDVRGSDEAATIYAPSGFCDGSPTEYLIINQLVSSAEGSCDQVARKQGRFRGKITDRRSRLHGRLCHPGNLTQTRHAKNAAISTQCQVCQLCQYIKVVEATRHATTCQHARCSAK
jgi:hypothetical protein